MPPELGLNRDYGTLPTEPDPFNALGMTASRMSFSDRGRYEGFVEKDLDGRAPFCAQCTANPELTYSVDRDVERDLHRLCTMGLFRADVIPLLSQWRADGKG